MERDYMCPTCKCNTCGNNIKKEGGWCKVFEFAPCDIKICSGNGSHIMIEGTNNYKKECREYIDG